MMKLRSGQSGVRLPAIALAAVAGLLMWAASARAVELRVSIAHVSSNASGVESASPIASPVPSPDGEYVLLTALGDDLADGDANGKSDIIMKEVDDGDVTMISSGTGGGESDGDSENPAVGDGDDGKVIAFDSDATNIFSGDTNGKRDIFVKNAASGAVTRASVSSSGAQGNNDSRRPSISSDGRYVAFESLANNLVASDTNGLRDIFVKDLDDGSIILASKALDGEQGNQEATAPALSSDGRYLAFVSAANDLDPIDTNNKYDVFLKDTTTGYLERASLDSNSDQVNGNSTEPSVAEDGLYVAFTSEAWDLVDWDSNGASDIFLKNMTTNAVTLISTNTSGAAANGDSSSPVISSDGRYVAFVSEATDLVDGDTNGVADLFVKDLETGTTERISESSSGTQANAASSGPSISPNGKHLAFASSAGNLYSGDSNSTDDAFLARLDRDAPDSAYSTSPSSANGNNGWFTSIPRITLTSTESGTTYYKWDSSSAGSWSTYSSSITGKSGTHTLYYYSVDELGNTESAESLTMKVDTSSPSVSFGSGAKASGAYAKGSITIPASASDSGSGIYGVRLYDGSTYLKIDTSSPYKLKLKTKSLSNGTHRLRLEAVDKSGRESSVVTRTLRVDNTRPKVSTPKNTRAKKGKTVRLYYKVTDAYTSRVQVKIKIRKAKGKGYGKLVKTVNAGWVKPGKLRSKSVQAPAKRGKYRFYVTANDKAGNASRRASSGKLTIR